MTIEMNKCWQLLSDYQAWKLRFVSLVENWQISCRTQSFVWVKSKGSTHTHTLKQTYTHTNMHRQPTHTCFGNNFKGSKGDVVCLKCGNHPESQDVIEECKVFEHIENMAKYREVYDADVSLDVAKIIESIVKEKKKSEEVDTNWINKNQE